MSVLSFPETKNKDEFNILGNLQDEEGTKRKGLTKQENKIKTYNPQLNNNSYSQI